MQKCFFFYRENIQPLKSIRKRMVVLNKDGETVKAFSGYVTHFKGCQNTKKWMKKKKGFKKIINKIYIK